MNDPNFSPVELIKITLSAIILSLIGLIFFLLTAMVSYPFKYRVMKWTFSDGVVIFMQNSITKIPFKQFYGCKTI